VARPIRCRCGLEPGAEARRQSDLKIDWLP
jgi:hypothetical protein